MSERSPQHRAESGKETIRSMGTVSEILSTYLFDPGRFWPEDSYFHRRNRSKIAKARAGLELKRPEDVEALLLPGLAARAAAGARTLFVVSNGASGCHFFGSVLASSPRYRLIGEVYFPPELAAMAVECDDPAAAHVLMIAFTALRITRRAAVPEAQKASFVPSPSAKASTPETAALAVGDAEDAALAAEPQQPAAAQP